MPTEQDFLEVIRANVGDDAPKLIYADWLDDQSDPRGELIRLLVEVQSRFAGHKHWQNFVSCVGRIVGTHEVDELIQLLEKRQMRLFACQCAEPVARLFEIENGLPKDERPQKAIKIAQNYLKDLASEEELNAACVNAFAAVSSAMTRASRAPDVNTKTRFRSLESAALVAYLACHAAGETSKVRNVRTAVRDSAVVGSKDARNNQLIWLIERLLGFKTD